MTLIKATPKIVIKRTDVALAVPTVPLSNDHTDGTWVSTDIYVGEFFLNSTDEKLYTRTDAGIVQLYPQDPGEVYATVLEYDTFADFPDGTGSPAIYPEAEVIYIAKDTNVTYRYDVNTANYVQLSSVAAMFWASIVDAPASTPAQIDNTVAAVHSVDAPNTSHYTIAESDGPAGNAGAKVDKVSGYDLSKNDFTDYYKALLDASLAEVQYYADLIAFPVTGEDSVLYAAKDTNLLYRWDGVSSPNAYVAFNEPYVADDEKLTLTNISEPASPTAGNSVLWFDVTTGKLKRKTSAGTVYDIENANLNFWQAGSGTEGVTMISAASPNINYGDNALATGNGNLTIGNGSFVTGLSNVIGLVLDSLEYVDVNKTLTYCGVDFTAVWTVGKQVMIFSSDRTVITVISAISTILASTFDGTDTQLELAVALGSDYSNVTVLSLDDSVHYSSALGAYNTVASAYSVALGASGVNSGAVSLTGGESCVASAYAAFSYGRSNVASGEFSVAFGSQTYATGDGSFATGTDTYAIGACSSVCGTSNYAGAVLHQVNDKDAVNYYVIFDDVSLIDEFTGRYAIFAETEVSYLSCCIQYTDASITNVAGKFSITVSADDFSLAKLCGYCTDTQVLNSKKQQATNIKWGDNCSVIGYASVCAAINSQVSGEGNIVTGRYLQVSGCQNLTSNVDFSDISGIANKVSSCQNVSVSGTDNKVRLTDSSIVSCERNTVTGISSSRVDGLLNVVTSTGSSHGNEVSGRENTVTDCNYCEVSGYLNVISALCASATGKENNVSGDYSHAEGNKNTITGTISHVEGYLNTVSGDNGAHGEGYGVTVTADGAHAEGVGSSAYIQGMHASSSKSSPSLTKQYGRITNGVKTTGATKTEMGDSDTRLKLNDNTAYMFRIMCVGFSSTGLTCSYSAKGTIKRVGGTVTLDHSSVTEDFDGITVTGLELSADDGASKCLRLDVTGKGSTKIEWNAVIEWSETGIAT